MKEKIFEYYFWFQNQKWERARIHIGIVIRLTFLHSGIRVQKIKNFPKPLSIRKLYFFAKYF